MRELPPGVSLGRLIVEGYSRRQLDRAFKDWTDEEVLEALSEAEAEAQRLPMLSWGDAMRSYGNPRFCIFPDDGTGLERPFYVFTGEGGELEARASTDLLPTRDTVVEDGI